MFLEEFLKRMNYIVEIVGQVLVDMIKNVQQGSVMLKKPNNYVKLC